MIQNSCGPGINRYNGRARIYPFAQLKEEKPMRMPRLRRVITSIAVLALVLPVTSVADAQSKGTIKIATQSPSSGKASSSAPSWPSTR
jgi:hypothetical protein